MQEKVEKQDEEQSRASNDHKVQEVPESERCMHSRE